MELTAFGKAVRKYRIDIDVRLADMAEELGVSAAYLSAVETGKKKLTDGFVAKVVRYFESRGIDAVPLRKAADAAQSEFQIDAEGFSDDSRMLMAAFARRFSGGDGFSEAQKEQLKKFLESFSPAKYK